MKFLIIFHFILIYILFLFLGFVLFLFLFYFILFYFLRILLKFFKKFFILLKSVSQDYPHSLIFFFYNLFINAIFNKCDKYGISIGDNCVISMIPIFLMLILKIQFIL